MAHNFDAFKPIDLIGVKQGDELTLRFYSIEETEWIVQRKVIMTTAKVKLKVVQSRYKKEAYKHTRAVEYKRRVKV